MNDYKNTLNLPHTDFPMKANLSQREPEILKKWEEWDVYGQLRALGEKRKKFILHDGPPFANGHIHIGHALNKTLKDIIVKAKTLSGFDSPLVPGWDCHGLPIELIVEKKIGKPGQKVSASEFRKACRAQAASQVDIQRQQFKRLGVIADWANPYLTMAPEYEANIIRSLAKIIEQGHVQRGYKPVHWCLDCASALAEAEVEYADKDSVSIDVRFTVVDTEDFWSRCAFTTTAEAKSLPVSIPIWTTTPWSLPANQAVALNPLFEYLAIAVNQHEIFIVAEDILSQVVKRYGIKNHTVLARIRGEQLAGLLLAHPFYAKKVPVILGNHVTADSGTGAVHTAPAHGQEDYVIGEQYRLPLTNPIGDDGCYLAATPLFAGIHVRKVNEKIIDELHAHHTLIIEEKIRHSYPHCWRHKTPLIFRATPQWFISMEQKNLRALALAAISRIDWLPEWGKSRIASMIENRPAWCISRQRTWGVPITVFVHKETGELHPNTLLLMEEVAKKVAIEGIEAWYTLEPTELLGEAARHYQKVKDVLDVWFDSGVTHECVLKKRPELHFPADLVLEGSDQHRGWFQSLLLTSTAINRVEPYLQALTHGFVVDAQGRKMSKSVGNVIAPEEVIQTLGADILRLWVASVDYRTEISASKEILNRMTETYRRVRNTARFLLANLNEFNPDQHLVQPDKMLMLDQFIVDKARRVQNEILKAYEANQFHLVIQKLHHFCVLDLGGFYLDIIKDRQYTMQVNSLGRRSAQTAIYHIALALVRWMAPVLSFTAEEIWQHLPQVDKSSVFLTEWYTHLAILSTDIVMNQTYWEKIRLVREAVNKEIEIQRNAGNIGSALEAEVTLYCAPNLLHQLNALGEELRFVLITAAANVVPEHAGPLDAVLTDLAGLSLKIEATEKAKCERCWHRREDVSANLNYPGICARCIENIAGAGEIRRYA